MNINRPIILASLGGLLLAMSFPPFPFFPFAFIGIIPLLRLFSDSTKTRHPLLWIYLAFFIYHGIGNWWVGSWQKESDPFLMAAGLGLMVVNPLFYLPQFAMLGFIKRRIGKTAALWTFPFLWTFWEWFHSLGDLSYPWLSSGYTQFYDHYFVQTADIGGVWFVGFLVALINIFIYYLIYERENINSKTRSYIISGLVLSLLIPNIYGIIRISGFNHKQLLSEKETIKVSIIQPDINPWRKWDRSSFDQIIMHRNIQDSLEKVSPGTDLCIWSETAIPFLNLDFNSRHDFTILQNWVDKHGFSLLTGFSDFYFYKPGDEIPSTAKTVKSDKNLRYDTFNSTMLLNPGMKNYDNAIYHKMKLTPFSERFPYAGILSFAKGWFEWGVGISGWQFGKEQKVLEMSNKGKKAKIGTIICIESIYPEFCTGFTGLGAELLTVITNDSWFKHTPGPEQHYIIAAFRAIENRRYIARCANSGISGIISPTGRTIVRAPEYESIGINGKIPLLEGKSIYVMAGDWIVYISLAILILITIYSFIRKRH